MTSQPKPLKTDFAACTIIAKNYLPMARVLADSWKRFHPDCPFFVLLLDSPAGFFSPEDEVFQPVLTSELDIPNLNGFLFKYTVLEASTAVKPYLLNYLFRRYHIDKLLYLDPDILIFESLAPLSSYLDEANILLTPHLLSPLPNDCRSQTDHDILKSGTYNLGFLGLRRGIESDRLLRWWSNKLYHHCLVSIEQHLFVDQRWMDLVPGLFGGVRILRDPGYNVAYWNLHERSVSVGESVTINGSEPLHFFHFSGFDADRPWIVSKHQNRFEMVDIGDACKLYVRYRDLLVEKGWDETKDWKYGHDFFRSGVKISPSARRYYWELGTDVMHFGDPFSWPVNGSQAANTDALEPCAPAQLLSGINLLGYVQAETGMGESARSNLRILRAAGIPCAVNNWEDPYSHNRETIHETLTTENPFLINLLNINADRLTAYAQEHPGYLRNHFNIGYWTWELPEFPEEWATSFGYADEIWTPSRFTRDAVASRSPIPVRVVPHSMEPMRTDERHVDRSRFDLGPDTFVFLFFFDFYSYLERKNPFGLIEAYKKAFGKRRDVQLLIKSVHGLQHPEDLSAVQRACAGSNVRVLDCVLPRRDKEDLMMAADCYVSLHRSEGFGLTLAEAMMCGKPVIATGYSGNMDFMSDEDSYPVPYRLVTIDKTCGPYKAGYHWADPDLDYAADAMREVEIHREAATEKGIKARIVVRKLHDPAQIAVSVRGRLDELGLIAKTNIPLSTV